MSFCGFVGASEAKLALILNAIDPRIGGVLFVGARGTGKSTLARSFAALLPDDVPFMEVPQNATEDALLGGVDIEESVRTGSRHLGSGLLARALGGVLHVDDVNVFSSDLLNLILNERDRIENGEEAAHDSSSGFILVGGMNPEEGALSPHVLDRFGLCSFFRGAGDKLLGLRVLKRSVGEGERKKRYARLDERLRKRVALAQSALAGTAVPGEIFSFVAGASLDANTVGHRGDLALLRAARAYAAFCGASAVAVKHVEKVLPLAFRHRVISVERTSRPESRMNELPDPELKQNEAERTDGEDSGKGEREEPSGESSEDSGEGDEREQMPPRSRIATPQEEIFAPGDAFRVRRISFDMDRVERRAAGRRTRTRHSGKGGRYIRSLERPKKKDIAVDATLRAAAPWQKTRGRSSNILVREEDLRFKQRERKMGHLAVFVVDCSGSMGAKKRMVETKSAILSLLVDCYEKRDKVSLIAFRKEGAEIVLPPTNSVELASKRLGEMPVGGRTPLGAGLLKSYELIRRTRVKEPHTRIVVIVVSDGRANHSMTEMSVKEEIRRCAGILREQRNVDFLVIDTEEKKGFMRADMAVELSGFLRAGYFTTDDLRAEQMVAMVGEVKRKQMASPGAFPLVSQNATRTPAR